MRRYDAAIDEQKNLLVALQNTMADTRKVLQGSASSTPTNTRDMP
jgi:hypothetical protein